MRLLRLRAVATRIARQFRRDPRSLLLMLVVPIFILTLLNWIFRTDPQPIQVAVAGEVGSPATAFVVDTLNMSEQIEASDQPLDNAMSELRAREIDALLLAPPEISPNDDDGMTITVIVEGSDPSRTGTTLNAISRTLPQAGFRILGLDGNPVQIDVEYLHGGPEFDRFDSFAPVYVAFFVFFFTYLLTSVSFLRERTTGTFEQLMVSPIRRGEIVTGYMLGFGAFAIIQSVIIILYVVLILGINHEGSLWLVIFFTILLAIGAVNLGIFLSAFARTELQVIQFIPLVIVPQVFLAGVLFRLEDLPTVLGYVAYAMPLTYANEALRAVMLRGESLTSLWLETLILTAFAILMIVVAALTLRREAA